MKLQIQIDQAKKELSGDINRLLKEFINKYGHLDITEIKIKLDPDSGDSMTFIRTDLTEVEERMPKVWRSDSHEYTGLFNSFFDFLKNKPKW